MLLRTTARASGSPAVRVRLQPRGPYSLRLSGRHGSDATRTFRDDILTTTLSIGGRLERARAAQATDGSILIEAGSEDGVDHVRFILGLDDDHSEFLRRFADDRLLGESLRRLRGLRPLRTATVAHSLLRAVAGQLITASRARQIERLVIRAATPELDGLHPAPTSGDLARFSPAALRNLGLGARRGATLVRLCRSLDLEALKGLPTEVAARRLQRERGLGPWSVGVVALEGLGRYERGLARDLGLVKLAGELWGRRVEPEETDALLEPYGEWGGLASVYLLAGYGAGLVPVPAGRPERRDVRGRRQAA